MSLSIFWREIRTRWRSILIWWFSVFGMAWLLAWSYNSIGTVNYSELISQYPPEFSAFFGEISKVSTPEGFMGVEFFNAVYPLMLGILALTIGTGILAKEEETGTLELLLASPLSRFWILTQKTLAMVKIIALVGSGAFIGVAFGVVFNDLNMGLVNPLIATVSGVMLGVVFGLFALMVTAITNRRGLSIGISTFFLVFSYFASTLPILIEQLEPFKYFSLFYYYNSEKILQGETAWLGQLLILLIGIIFYILSYLGFSNRDVGV